MSMVALDIETTGLDPKIDSITEIAAVRFTGETIEDTYQTLVNPNRPIPSNIVQLTHITNEMVRNAPQIMSVLPGFAAFVGEDQLVGQNIAFDLSFLRQGGILRKNPFVDTYDLASALLPSAPRYSLSALAELLNVEVKDAHRALADSKMTFHVYNRLLQRAAEIPFDQLYSIVTAAKNANWNCTETLREILSKRAKAGETLKKGPSLFEGFSPKWNDTDTLLKPVDSPNPLNSDELTKIISEGGAFSEHFPNFEERPEQIDMLRSVSDAFSQSHHMMIEAGTGTGKSFAYLIPAFHWAKENGYVVVISTNTINLQDQLIKKDIPELERILGTEIRATVQKGRGNYLCPRRLVFMQSRGAQTPEEIRVLSKVLIWLSANGSGDRGEINLNGPVERDVWQRLSAEYDGCRSNACSFRRKGQCPFYNVKDQAQHSHIVIVNHALLLADAAQSGRVLPDYKYLVIDEGHHLESAATNAFSFRVTPFDLSRMLQEIGTSKSGLLGRLMSTLASQITKETYQGLQNSADRITERSSELEVELRALFDVVVQFLAESRDEKPLSVYGQQLRIIDSIRTESGWSDIEISWDNAGSVFDEVLKELSSVISTVSDFDDMTEEASEVFDQLVGMVKRATETKKNLENLFLTPEDGAVYWIDVSAVNNRLSLNMAPLNIGPTIQSLLWHEKECVILTSATLTTDNSFEYMRSRLCAEDAETFCVGSPYDYEEKVLLYIPNDIPEPSQGSSQQMVEFTLNRLCKAVGGRTLVLFTSYAQLKRTANAITQELHNDGITVFEQGEGISASALLETFRHTEKAVLLGTRSFWEGVDIQGEQLSVVVIVKLPFDVPSDPIIAARSESLDNPFAEYSLPEAILKFRQGFGRLIRSKNDKGVVLILDTRMLSKRYGKDFLSSIPKCTTRITSIRDLPREAKHWLGC